MKFLNIAAAMTLFASSFTWATTLPSGEVVEPTITELLQRFEQNELRIEQNETQIASLLDEVKILKGW